jgi:hypothetical protein
MNFVDAAVALLREAAGPLHVEELCRLALERGLLDSPGAAPLRSLKGRLTTELKRGPESRVVRVEDDVWGLADAGRNGTEGSDDEPATEPGDRAAAHEIEVHAGFPDVEERGARHVDPGGAEGELDEGEHDLVHEQDDEDDDDDEFDDDEAELDEGEIEESEADDEEDDDDLDDDEDDDDDLEEDEFDEAGEPIGDEIGGGSGQESGEIGEDRAAAGEITGELAGASSALTDAEQDVLDEDLVLEEVDHEALARQQEAIAQERAGLSLEEQELVRAYGDEAGTAQLGQLAEYRDHQTADEDRPMVPETLPERRGRGREDWKARRERMREKRRERREERERNKTAREQSQAGKDGAKESGKEAKEAGKEKEVKEAGERAGQATPAVEATEAPRRDAVPAGEGDLARRACEVLASVKGAQPVPVRQLAQMMRKRRLVEVDPEVLWRPLKAALLADHQRRIAAGLPPRVAYRGRDLFSYRPGANAELEAAEGALETAAHRLRGATERALAARLVELALPVLEQVVQLYLVQMGWRDVEWIKRVDRSGYATAREPGEGAPVLIGARAGNQEVDRRGVGELRAGVTAKNLARGLLLAPRELGSDARAELEREGKPVSAMCGLRWACALVDAGIGVAQRAMPVSYLDPELFDRLSEG